MVPAKKTNKEIPHKENDPKRKILSEKKMALLRKSATIHPGLETLVFHSMQPNILRNVYQDFFLYEITPEEIRRPYDVSIPESQYKYPRCMNVTYFYRYKYLYGYHRNGNHQYVLCNEAIVRRMMFNDFCLWFVKGERPSGVSTGVSDLPFAHARCDGIRAKTHVPFQFKSEYFGMCKCRGLRSGNMNWKPRKEAPDSVNTEVIASNVVEEYVKRNRTRFLSDDSNVAKLPKFDRRHVELPEELLEKKRRLLQRFLSNPKKSQYDSLLMEKEIETEQEEYYKKKKAEHDQFYKSMK